MFLRNFVEFGIFVEFRSTYCVYTWFYHEIHDCHSGSDGKNTENIELSLSELLPVNLVHRLYLSVAVTGNKYCICGQVQRPWKINYYMWKICRGERRNLPYWPTEFGKMCRGKLWSLSMYCLIWSCLKTQTCHTWVQLSPIQYNIKTCRTQGSVPVFVFDTFCDFLPGSVVSCLPQQGLGWTFLWKIWVKTLQGNCGSGYTFGLTLCYTNILVTGIQFLS